MTEEDMITFEFIRKIQRDEVREPKLTKLPDSFYEKAKSYIEEKKKLAKKKSDRTTSIEITNIERLLEEIMNRRETKLLNFAILTVRTGILPGDLLEQEKQFFESLVDTIKTQRERVLNLLFEKTKEQKEIKEERYKVEFIENVDEFVGVDLKKYGPFKKGDMSTLPKENAEVMINFKKAKMVK